MVDLITIKKKASTSEFEGNLTTYKKISLWFRHGMAKCNQQERERNRSESHEIGWEKTPFYVDCMLLNGGKR